MKSDSKGSVTYELPAKGMLMGMSASIGLHLLLSLVKSRRADIKIRITAGYRFLMVI